MAIKTEQEIASDAELEDFTTDPFDLLNIKTEEVVVKVECIDEKNYVMDIDTMNNIEPEPLNNRKLTKTINAHNKKICRDCGDIFDDQSEYKKHMKNHRKMRARGEGSQQEVPAGFKKCPLCGKTMLKDSIYKHVSQS